MHNQALTHPFPVPPHPGPPGGRDTHGDNAGRAWGLGTPAVSTLERSGKSVQVRCVHIQHVGHLFEYSQSTLTLPFCELDPNVSAIDGAATHTLTHLMQKKMIHLNTISNYKQNQKSDHKN